MRSSWKRRWTQMNEANERSRRKKEMRETDERIRTSQEKEKSLCNPLISWYQWRIVSQSFLFVYYLVKCLRKSSSLASRLLLSCFSAASQLPLGCFGCVSIAEAGEISGPVIYGAIWSDFGDLGSWVRLSASTGRQCAYSRDILHGALCGALSRALSRAFGRALLLMRHLEMLTLSAFQRTCRTGRPT